MFIVMLKILCAVFFAFLYSLGGMYGTWIRRYVAPCFLGMCLFYFSGCSSMSFITAIFISGTLHLGYGASTLWGKILRRSIYGVSNGISSASQMCYRKKWGVAIFQIVLFTSVSVYFGVCNPLEARAEEALMGLMIALLPLLSVREEK